MEILVLELATPETISIHFILEWAIPEPIFALKNKNTDLAKSMPFLANKKVKRPVRVSIFQNKSIGKKKHLIEYD